jgi:hypothetical protein
MKKKKLIEYVGLKFKLNGNNYHVSNYCFIISGIHYYYIFRNKKRIAMVSRKELEKLMFNS